ncbi:hypothetical protein N7478_003339 [Penicillium angulare]|uniref:uncharacterized protein n=1 Tax=Penicillium angulare TaxID=116970 RepID=UPI002541D20F|nr:uncharacterized protein N7478_003339 [Penicillium angulare]KAJ5287653.1 hypothetical protein N7478_003339 [Penicillium angulare]
MPSFRLRDDETLDIHLEKVTERGSLEVVVDDSGYAFLNSYSLHQTSTHTSVKRTLALGHAHEQASP